MAVTAEMVGAERVDRDQDDVARMRGAAGVAADRDPDQGAANKLINHVHDALPRSGLELG